MQRDRASVKAKGEKRFLEAVASHGPKVLQKHATANIAHRLRKQSRLQSHTPEASSSHTAAHPSRPCYQLVPSSPASSPRPLPQAKRRKITPVTSSPISISSSSPSPLCVLELTDSDGDAPLITPVTHGPSQPFVNVKQEARDASVGKSPRRRHTSTPVEKKWPSDYYVVDVAYVLDACKVPPPGQTISWVFESIVPCKFIQSTYYDAKGRWDVASQEDHDLFKILGCTAEGLWSVFAARIPLKNAPLCAACQRQARQACRVKSHSPRGESEDFLSDETSDMSIYYD